MPAADKPNLKQILRTECLPALAASATYFSHAEIRDFLAQRRVVASGPTVRRYLHEAVRDPHTGRINPRNLQHPYPVDASALRALKCDLLKRVGELAAGWNAGARKLGVKLPAWVARHSSKRSGATVINAFIAPEKKHG